MPSSSEVVEKLNNYVNSIIEVDGACGKYHVELRKQPCYLSSFLLDENQNSDIILVYKDQDVCLGDETAAVLRNLSLLNLTQDSNVSGHPLENTLDNSNIKVDDFTVNETITFSDKELHYPVGSSIAMRILNYATLNVTTNLPVWILHDSTDNQKSVLLGKSKNRNWCTRSWVTVQGLLDKSPSIDDMLAKHHSYNKSTNRLTTEVSCRFCLLISGNVFVHATWNKPSFEIPSSGATMSLELNAKVGDSKSSLTSLWQQLLLLQKYFDVVCQWKKSSYPLWHQQNNVTLPTSNNVFQIDRESSSLNERIIDALMSPHHWSSDYGNTSFSYEEILRNIEAGETRGMDLVDRLWIILSECSTYEELNASIALVFQQVRKCPVQPYISLQKKSKMAEVIKIISSDSSANPLLMLEPLEVLIEIGLEKLVNDYIALFTQSDVVKEDMVNVPVFPSFTTMDNLAWIDTVSSYLTWLSKTHAIAELVYVALSGIEVRPKITTIISRIFGHYHSLQESTVHSIQYLCDNPDVKFVTPIAVASLPKHDIRDMPYEKWLMKLTTQDESVSVTNWFLYTTSSLFPESVYTDIINISSANYSNDCINETSNNKSHYFVAQMTSFSNAVGKYDS